MTVSSTTRLGITRWTAGTDPFTRVQMAGSHDALEAVVATFTKGTVTPAPGAAYDRAFYLNTATGSTLQYCDGSVWYNVVDFGSGSGTTFISGGISSAGVATKVARSDHSHGAVTASPIAIGTSILPGVGPQLTYADHQHVVGVGAINNANMFANGVITAAKISGTAALSVASVTTSSDITIGGNVGIVGGIYCGNARVDNNGTSANFAHASWINSTSAAITQTPAGETQIRARGGQKMRFFNQGTEVISFRDSGGVAEILVVDDLPFLAGMLALGMHPTSKQIGQALSAPSSRRFKTNIVPLEQQDVSDALGSILALKPVGFDYDPTKMNIVGEVPRQYGFIAEEVAKVDPLLVSFVDDEPTAIQWQLVTTLSVAAIQDLARRVSDLESGPPLI